MRLSTCLGRLEAIRTEYTPVSALEKNALLSRLDTGRLGSATQVRRLHELLCYLRAWPDDPAVFLRVESMLAGFGHRPDLKRFRVELVNSGIGGTDIIYRLYWPMARWLACHWPQQLVLEWRQIERTSRDRLVQILPLLLPAGESAVLDDISMPAQDWMQQLKGPTETDAQFYLRRLQTIYRSDSEREQLHDELDLTYRLRAAPATPSIANSLLAPSRIHYQTRPLHRARMTPDEYWRQFRCRIRPLSVEQGSAMVDLARKTMLTHERDLDAFSYGNPADVILIDAGSGYQLACIGLAPERRYLLHVSYGLLTLKNGVPVAYCPVNTLFACAEIAFNLFPAFRGAESTAIYCLNLAVVRRLFGATLFRVDPYQLGYQNQDGLKSGVWWFYYKLGFRPRDGAIAALAEQELARMRNSAGYRSGMATLNRLASGPMYYAMGQTRVDPDIFSCLEGIPSLISRWLAAHYGADRERGIREAATRAGRITGLRPRTASSGPVRDSWQAFSPLICNLPGIGQWTAAQRRSMGQIALLKGADIQTTYLKKVNAHTRLRESVLALADRDVF